MINIIIIILIILILIIYLERQICRQNTTDPCRPNYEEYLITGVDAYSNRFRIPFLQTQLMFKQINVGTYPTYFTNVKYV